MRDWLCLTTRDREGEKIQRFDTRKEAEDQLVSEQHIPYSNTLRYSVVAHVCSKVSSKEFLERVDK